MIRRTAAACALLLLVPLAAAAQETGDIPVTTSSEPALDAFRQGERHLDGGRTDEARIPLRRAVEIDPRFTYAWLRLADGAASPGEFREAMERATATTSDKSRGEQLLVAISETYLSADAERRLEMAEELVAAYPWSPRAWLAHGFALQSVDRHDASRQSFFRAIEVSPGLYAPHAAIGFSYLFNEPRNAARAVTFLEEGARISPNEAKSHEALGDGYRALGDLGGARAAYQKALELDPALGVASLKRGHVNSFLRRFDEARRDYDDGIRGAVGPNRITFANYRAFVHVHADRPEAAVRELRDLAEEASRGMLPANDTYSVRVFTLTNAASIALHHGLEVEAREVLKERAHLMRRESERLDDPDFMRRQEADIHLWSARLSAVGGDLERAKEELQRHRELLERDRDPTRLQGYHLVLGLIALEEGASHRAVSHLRRADLENQYAKYHLAVALEAAGRRSESSRLFDEVAGYNFNSVDYALVRGEALAKMRG